MSADILIVSNHPELARELCDGLARRGHDCRIVGTAAEARRELDLREPDVVVADVHLPDGSGLELQKMHHGAYPDIQWLLASGDLELLRRHLRSGAPVGYALVEKPVRLGTVLEFVKRTTSPAGAQVAATLVHIRAAGGIADLRPRMRDRLFALGLIEQRQGRLVITDAGNRYCLAEARRAGLLPSDEDDPLAVLGDDQSELSHG